MIRRWLPLCLALGLAGCSDKDAPRRVDRPATARQAPVPPPAAASADPDDPAEPGIPDLARLARYVFRTMKQHDEVCPFENPFRDKLHFAFAITVAGGRMQRVELGEVALERASGKRALSKAQQPRELAAYVSCLAPHLASLQMDPAPADGRYDPLYSFGGQAGGRPAP
jgi:hypothetical protein